MRFAQLGNFVFFTFQSGSIQICIPYEYYIIINSLHSNLVLFKCKKKVIDFGVAVLYIPIWFYSNDGNMAVGQVFINFTFQSGSIQISAFSNQYLSGGTLHSNLVLFKSVHIIPPIYTA